MIFIYKTVKFAPVWTTILKIRAISVHRTLTEHNMLFLCGKEQLSDRGEVVFHPV